MEHSFLLEGLKSVPSFAYTCIAILILTVIGHSLSGFFNKVPEMSAEEAEDYVRDVAKEVIRDSNTTDHEIWESVLDAALDSGVLEKKAKKILEQETRIYAIEGSD